MTTLEMNKVHTHTPLVSAISTHNEIAYTICVECDQNIESFYIDFDNDRLGRWSKWEVSV
jgi:hypothetical protein